MHKNTVRVRIVQDGAEHTDTCSCCGRPLYSGCGALQTEDKVVADYWYRYAEGHECRFHLAIAFYDSSGNPVENGGVCVVMANVVSGNISYSVTEPEASPWKDFGAYGPVLQRATVLAQASSTNLFGVVDAITANEQRLSERILNAGIHA